MKLLSLRILFLSLLISVPLIGSAQNASSVGLDDVLEVKVNPEYPRAFEPVHISVRSYNSDLDRANITWYLNETAVLKGVGKTSLDFKTEGVGDTTTVRMEAQTTTGSFIVRTFSFRPGDVDLLWESDSHTPPFYKGKKLHSNEGNIRIVALPTLREQNGVLAEPSNLVYEWKLGSKVLADQSGFGKQAISLSKESTFKSNVLVHVIVSTLDSTSSAKGTLRVSPTNPLVLLYENNPVLGVLYNKALLSGDSVSLTEDEIAIHAEPFFFSVNAITSPKLTYKWYLNGKTLNTPRNPYELILRQTGGSGDARIQVRVQHDDNILQGSQASTNLQYSTSGTPRSSIF